ncbi:unnamed protein product [Closterium sp. Naga37s-1]|nr:unnamed protein product [Closterium sp. Naga37s-1]
MAPAETDEGEAADEPPNDPPARTGLDFLRAVHANPPPVDTAGPSACSNEKEAVATPCASNPVAPDSAPATVSVTEVGESSSAASKKRRRFAQGFLPFDTPPAKPTPPPVPVQAPNRASRELTDAEKAEEKFLKAQQLYITQWLPRFDWLLLDKNDEGLPILRCSICVEHGKDDAKFRRNGTRGRDLQVGSMRCHKLSGRHDEAMKRQRTLMAEIEKQKRIDDFANTDKEGARLTRLMRGVEFICDHDAPIAMFPKLIGFLAEEGVEDIPLHEALVVKDAAKAFPDLNMIDAAVRAEGEIICLAKEVDHTITIITHRYIVYGATFGGGVSKLLSKFIKEHGGDNRTMVVEGIDAEGRQTTHKFELSETPIKKHKFGGTLADCEKLCTGFAKEIVARMKYRMWDLQHLDGAKLFQVESWPSRDDQHELKTLEWLAQNDELFGGLLPGSTSLRRAIRAEAASDAQQNGAATEKAAALILIRHGESLWNSKNLFTGCVDVPLSEKGVNEAIEAGKRISEIPVDVIFTSALIRAQMTAMLAMTQHRRNKVPVILHEESQRAKDWSRIFSENTDEEIIPVITAWELNERMYGELQGLNKKETADKYGMEQVVLWRRSYDVPPPNGESLAMCAERAVAYFKENVEPRLTAGENVMIAAHGNSLRAIIMYLDSLTSQEVIELELSTGVPMLYIFQGSKFLRRGSPLRSNDIGVFALTEDLAQYRTMLDTISEGRG